MKIKYISQVALGTTSPVNLGTLFSGEMGGNSFAFQCVSGSITVGLDNTVTASTGWPVAAGQGFSTDSQTFRDLWAVGGATDRIAVMVEG